MLNLGDTQWLPAINSGYVDIPAFSPVSIVGTKVPSYTRSNERRKDRSTPTSFDAVLSVSRPTSYNDRALGVTGPLPMKVNKYGYVAVGGVVRTDLGAINMSSAESMGTIKDSFVMQIGHGLITIPSIENQLSHTLLCTFEHGQGNNRGTYGYSGSAANGSALGGGSSAGAVRDNSSGDFLVGFSATCWAPDTDAESLITLQVFANGPGVYTGISASAENHWQKTAGTSITYSNQHRVNIAASGIARTEVAGGFNVRNVSGFTISYSSCNVWHKSF